MDRPVVIVDPWSSGVELAPTFQAKGISCIAVTTKEPPNVLGYGTTLQREDFLDVIPNRPDLEEVLRTYNPLAVLAGSDGGMALAERLAAALAPEFCNDPDKQPQRLHKALMQQELEKFSIPALSTLASSDEGEVRAWICERGLEGLPLIVKPASSAGSDNVFHIDAGEDWRPAFRRILLEVSKITGRRNELVVVQEQAFGTEFALGTVSANGRHYLAHIIRYKKTEFEGRKTVYDHVEFVPFVTTENAPLFVYAQKVLDVLGIRWGAAHVEIMLTERGPRLIEVSPRMCGGPVVCFAREACGSSQADKLAEIFSTGDVASRDYTFQRVLSQCFCGQGSRA
jgi:biotin carboxylase